MFELIGFFADPEALLYLHVKTFQSLFKGPDFFFFFLKALSLLLKALPFL